MYKRELQFEIKNSPEEVKEFINEEGKGRELINVVCNGEQYVGFYYEKVFSPLMHSPMYPRKNLQPKPWLKTLGWESPDIPVHDYMDVWD